MSSQPGIISGTVTNESGATVSGATVEAIDQDSGDRLYRTTTDANGDFSMGVVGGSYHVVARWQDSDNNVFTSQSAAFINVESAIPDAVVAQYHFEDDSDSSVEIDDVGSNNADITGATYDADAQSGAFALSHDGTGDYLQSQSTVDLVSSGDTNAIGLGGFTKPQSTNRFPYAVAYGPTTGDFFGIWVDVEGGSGLNARLLVDGSSVDVNTSVAFDSYQHVYANATDSDINIIVNGAVADSATHSIDISNLGAGSLWTGIRPDKVSDGDYSLDGLVDNATYSDGQLTETDVQTLINQ